MNKQTIRNIVLLSTLLLLLLILTLFVVFRLKNNIKPETSDPPQNTTQSVTEATTITQTSAAPLYIVGQWNGKLAVFTLPNTTAPSKIYDVYLTSLPTEEQQRLKTGIPVYDQQTLQSLLEDYTS